MDSSIREKKIYRVTLKGSAVNVVLLFAKFAAGILGGSAAMIADAVHSLSDFLTDFVVMAFVKLSAKPQDEDHDYGHGKYETLATAFIGVLLFFVGVMILYNGAISIYKAFMGEKLPVPGAVALIVALMSIALKEWAYRFTVKVGKEVDSQAVVANAWHHRTDAFSSVATAAGVGAAFFLGEKWAVLDPVAAVLVSVLIVKTAFELITQACGELLEKSLPPDVEERIIKIAESEPEVSDVHGLKTRRIGSRIAVEMHFRLPGGISLYHAHCHASNIEQKLKQEFGNSTHISIHFEPEKIDGKYCCPDNFWTANTKNI
ncbi:MAG: cation diffusion facilitator family transporter [Bacteroidales bacterium]|nr:cation diffusion facilitator family transporter [Bacteroidales bacterium]